MAKKTKKGKKETKSILESERKRDKNRDKDQLKMIQKWDKIETEKRQKRGKKERSFYWRV